MKKYQNKNPPISIEEYVRDLDASLRLSLHLIDLCRHYNATVTEAAKYLGISESTATRILHELRSQGETINVKRGRPKKSRPAFTPPRKISTLSSSLDEVCISLLNSPFPYPKPLTEENIAREIRHLRTFDIHLEGNVITPWSPLGIRLCTPYFPNRYAATWGRSISAENAWKTERELRKAIDFQVRYGDPTTPNRVLHAITMHCRTPTVFRPTIARFVYEKYCPHGGITWDPCAGYGGRLLAAHAAGVHYIGTDVDPETIRGNQELSRAIGAISILHLTPAEVFRPPNVDLVFTSPPYFDRERYSHEPTQSWKRHENLDAWLDGFLRPMIQTSLDVLSAKGHLVLNIADLKNRTIPLVAKTIGVAREIGFDHVDTLLMPLASIKKLAPAEPILVFKKTGPA